LILLKNILSFALKINLTTRNVIMLFSSPAGNNKLLIIFIFHTNQTAATMASQPSKSLPHVTATIMQIVIYLNS